MFANKDRFQIFPDEQTIYISSVVPRCGILFGRIRSICVRSPPISSRGGKYKTDVDDFEVLTATVFLDDGTRGQRDTLGVNRNLILK